MASRPRPQPLSDSERQSLCQCRIKQLLSPTLSAHPHEAGFTLSLSRGAATPPTPEPSGQCKARRSTEKKKRKRSKRANRRKFVGLEDASCSDTDGEHDLVESTHCSRSTEDGPRAAHFRHIVPGFSADTVHFDNGGMGIFEVSQLLLIGKHFECLLPIREIAKQALRDRVTALRFNRFGVVSLEFRRLPAVAVNIILRGDSLRSWSENDIFLAVTQWAAFPLHARLPSLKKEEESNDTSRHTAGRHIENPRFVAEDTRREAVCRRFNAVQDHIRFHLLDPWFMDIAVKNYHPLQRNAKAMLVALQSATKTSLCVVDPNHSTNPRLKDVVKFLEKAKPIRTMPGAVPVDVDPHSNSNRNPPPIVTRAVAVDPREDRENRDPLRAIRNIQGTMTGPRGPMLQRQMNGIVAPRHRGNGGNGLGRGRRRDVRARGGHQAETEENTEDRGDWQSLVTRTVSAHDLQRRTQHYDVFTITFSKSDLVSLAPGSRVTSHQLVR